MNVKLYNTDCLVAMQDIPDSSVDLILCDLPYGTTKCPWDVVIPFDKLWEQYNRIIKPTGNIVLFSSGLFTYQLVSSNIKNFRYKLIWKKNVPTGMSSAKYRPMKYYEEICVFYKENPTYNLSIVGHTDSSGDSEKNLKLSQDRAASVKDYLIMKGVDASRIRTDGKGDTEPVADNETVQGRTLNRRVAFEIEYME
jgi:DNA modification methylase